MKSVSKIYRRTAQAALLVLATGVAGFALAAGTPSGTTVGNLATVDYEVNGVVQLAIESSPTGNSTPGSGFGTATDFVVDNRVDLTVAEVSGAAENVNPGQADAWAAFTVTNTGNTTQDYELVAANLAAGTVVHGAADDEDLNNVRAFVDVNGNGTFEVATDTDTFISNLAADATITVFIVVDTPFGAVNGAVGNVSLTAITHDAGSGAASLTVETVGADDPNVVDVVFADAGENGQEADNDGFLFAAADLLITKSSTVINDPFNLGVDPKAIPGATIEYVIELQNTGGISADQVLVTDIIGPELTLVTGQYNAGASDIRIELGVGPASVVFCTVAVDADGCQLTGSTLEVSQTGGLSVGTTVADNPVRVLFQATIN